jgi:hypothetical protein
MSPNALDCGQRRRARGLHPCKYTPIFQAVVCRLWTLAEERARQRQMQVLPRNVQVLLCRAPKDYVAVDEPSAPAAMGGR